MRGKLGHIVKKLGMKSRIALSGFSISSSDGLLWTRYWIFGSFWWPAESQLDSHSTFGCMKLIEVRRIYLLVIIESNIPADKCCDNTLTNCRVAWVTDNQLFSGDMALTCYRAQCRAARCVLTGHAMSPHRHNHQGSISAYNHSIPVTNISMHHTFKTTSNL